MDLIKTDSYLKGKTRQERDIIEMERIDDLIGLYKDYINKIVIPRLPQQSIGNIKESLGLRNIAENY